MTSRKPQAEPFQDWVCQEVLPSIRKTGSYQVKPMTPGELIKLQAEAIIALEQEQNRLRLEQESQWEEITQLKQLAEQHDAEIDRIFNPYGRYYTVLGLANLKGIKALPISQMQAIGKRCSAYCKANDIPIEKVNDPRFGQINSYPEDVIQQFI